ncbi:MAG: TIGR03557 family F420-dependent LLM class oxidoreductase [Sciscionella sp.]|nr:TIGR03557 family F420-dependent LLM class oxidoreductase [Sciscionella sp.]
MKLGYFLASEEYGPRELVRQAKLAEAAGFDRLWISDHFHPWNDHQGNSPFVWSVIGALSEVTRLPITTAVTCPLIRTHPAIVAQAAATAAVQTDGRFTLGVGTGEALNEHIFGAHWPASDVRRAMLTEAVELIRALHRGGELTYRGQHYTVEQARIYTLPEQPVPIYVSAFGPKAAKLAGQIGDGFISMLPRATLVRAFRDNGGGRQPAQAGLKVCYARSESDGVRTAHRLWANDVLPGELAQLLPTPRQFESASTLVDPDAVANAMPCGPDPERYVRAIGEFDAAGYDELYVQQIGTDQRAFFDFWADKVAPRLGALELAST